jgi:hypothetical protein
MHPSVCVDLCAGYACVCVYIYIYIYMHTHTYIHTYMAHMPLMLQLIGRLKPPDSHGDGHTIFSLENT